MINKLLGIQFNIEKARLDGKVQNLACYINEDTLTTSHNQMDRKKAKGIDGTSKDDYSVNLKANIENLVRQMRNGSYQPQPIRRTYIPKDGSKKMRPLGISCYEDKLIENVIAKILIEVYETKFFNKSYGFRPNRNCHQAVREIIENVQYHKVNYIVEADIKGFFRCKVKTSKKKFRSKVKTMKGWIKKNRIMPVGKLIKKINQKLRGHYQYYGVTDNTRGVKSYQNSVKWMLFKWLNRRSQRKSYTVDTFYNGLLKTFSLLEPIISISLFYR